MAIFTPKKKKQPFVGFCAQASISICCRSWRKSTQRMRHVYQAAASTCIVGRWVFPEAFINSTMVLTYLKNHTGLHGAQGGGENTYCIRQTVFQTPAKGHMLKLIGFNYKSLL